MLCEQRASFSNILDKPVPAEEGEDTQTARSRAMTRDIMLFFDHSNDFFINYHFIFNSCYSPRWIGSSSRVYTRLSRAAAPGR